MLSTLLCDRVFVPAHPWMNALADAAFLSRPDGVMAPLMPGGDLTHLSQPMTGMGRPPLPGATPYSEQEMQAMGLLNGPVNGSIAMPPQLHGMPPPPIPPLPTGMSSQLMPPLQGGNTGRHLQILDHTVHRIDATTKANGEEEKEMVVSNLRHFNLKIGVLDPRNGGFGMGRDLELPLRAELCACLFL